MSYIEKVLVDGEKIVYGARVTWSLYIPGFAVCLVALLCAWALPGLDQQWGWLWQLSTTLDRLIPIGRAAEVITYSVFSAGVILVLKVYTLSAFTEIAVTNRRVIAKTGITKTITTEIDRNRIASVEIEQTMVGQMFNCGYVTLRGFSSMIGGLPPISKPYAFQKAINEVMGPR